MGFDIRTTVNISSEEVENLFCSAFEGGYSQWIRDHENLTPYETGENVVYYGRKGYFDTEYRIELTFDDPESDGEKKIIIDREATRRGLQTLAEKFPHHFADIVNDNTDAITGNVLLQCIALGDIIYD